MINLKVTGSLLILMVGWFTKELPKQEKVSMPADEAQFCSLLESSDATYEPARKSWYDETNGIIKDKIGLDLERIVDERNNKILDIFGRSKPHIQNWVVRLDKIDTIDLMHDSVTKHYIEISGTFPCNLPVTFTAVEILAVGEKMGFLEKRKVGDYILISASMLSHDSSMNPPQKAIEWNGFQGYSMASPAYKLNVERMSEYNT